MGTTIEHVLQLKEGPTRDFKDAYRYREGDPMEKDLEEMRAQHPKSEWRVIRRETTVHETVVEFGKKDEAIAATFRSLERESYGSEGGTDLRPTPEVLGKVAFLAILLKRADGGLLTDREMEDCFVAPVEPIPLAISQALGPEGIGSELQASGLAARVDGAWLPLVGHHQAYVLLARYRAALPAEVDWIVRQVETALPR